MLPFTRTELSDAVRRVGICGLPPEVPVSVLQTYLSAAIVHGFAHGELKDGEPDTEMMRQAISSLKKYPYLLEFSKTVGS